MVGNAIGLHDFMSMGHRKKFYHYLVDTLKKDSSTCLMFPVKQSCTPGKAGGLICEPLKAAEYLNRLKAVSSTNGVAQGAYLPLPDYECTLESFSRRDQRWIHSTPAPKNFVQQNFSPCPAHLWLWLSHSSP